MKNKKNAEKLFSAISDINQSDIEDFAKYDDRCSDTVTQKKERPVLKIIDAFAACVVLFGGIFTGLKIAEMKLNPNGPASSSEETGDTADDTEEIQVKYHVYKMEGPYALPEKNGLTAQEQEIADRYYNELIENFPEFAKIPRQRIVEYVDTRNGDLDVEFGFCLGNIGTGLWCNYKYHEYSVKEYDDFCNGWTITGKNFEEFADAQLPQIVCDDIISMLKKNVRAFAEENGLEIARFVDHDPDDILERVIFSYDENGLYATSITIAGPKDTKMPTPHIFATIGVEISADTVTLTEYPASLKPLFTSEENYEYTFYPSGIGEGIQPPYATPEKKEFTAEQKETVDRVYNVILEKYPDFGKIPREMLLEEITKENLKTTVAFTLCLGGLPTSYQYVYNHSIGGGGAKIFVSGQEFKPFSEWRIPENSMGTIRSVLYNQTRNLMKAEKLDLEKLNLNDLSISWSVGENGELYANSEYIADITDKTVNQYGEDGHAHVFNKVRVVIENNEITVYNYPAVIGEDITHDIPFSETEPETDATDTREYNGRIYAENETFVGEYKTESVSVSVSNVREGDLSYYICDITLSSAEDLRTAFAGNSLSGRDYTSKIAQSAEAGFAVNGDYCGYRKAGIIIREGKLCRDEKAYGWDLCYMDKNGDLIVCKNDEEDGAALLNDDVWQSWCFGPTLVKDHKALSNDEFCAPDISKKDWARESRTAIGQIDALHYIILIVDSKRVSDDIGGWNIVGGMNFDELAAAFEALGCKVAYNLDGGGSTTLYLNGKVVNEPSGESERKISDIIYLK